MATLELYLIRHGIAEDRGDEWPDDSKRPLTREGISKLKKSTRGLAALGVTIEQIVASPLVRTRQTAEAVAATLKNTPPIAISDALAPDGTTADIVEEIGTHVRKGRVALVGHEPNLGELAAHLIGAHAPIEFKKGGMCRIDLDELPPKGRGTLIWFAPPRMLRKIGE